MTLKKLIAKVLHWWWLLRRPMTLGVRIMVVNNNQEILLVRHSYVEGWYFPGGGVERGETFDQAAKKEVLEETGIRANFLELKSLHYNHNASPRDHVALYLCREFERVQEFVPNREIAEIGFFPLKQLPDGTTGATRRRLAEIFENEPASANW